MAFGRLLLILAAVSLITMPLTQHIWTWDHFLRGGQDFESGMLILVTILCLAVLLSQLCKRHVDLLFAARSPLALFCTDRESAGIPLAGEFTLFRAEHAPGSALGIYMSPLRV